MFEKNPDVIYLDATYKTNKYGLPLINICGCTGNNKTVQIGFAIIENEREESFVWIFRQLREMIREKRIDTRKLFVTDRDRACLNALTTVFPEISSILCAWHRGKDVKAYARSLYKMVENPDRDEEGEDPFVDNEKVEEFMHLY